MNALEQDDAAENLFLISVTVSIDFRGQGFELFAQFSPYRVPGRLQGLRQIRLFHLPLDALSIDDKENFGNRCFGKR